MSNTNDDVKSVDELGIVRERVVKELRKVIVNMNDKVSGGVAIISCLKAYTKDARFVYVNKSLTTRPLTNADIFI